MDVEKAGAAAAGPPTETVSAERVASDKGDVGAFLQASRDRRTGKAQANVERPKAEPKAEPKAAAVVAGRDGQPAKGPTDKDRDADERLTTRIRESVETSTAELRRKNEELEQQIAGLRRGATDRQPAADGGRKVAEAEKRVALTSADIKRYQALPGAPKLDDKDAAGAFVYETTQEHAIAMADFIRESRASERAEASRGQAAGTQRLQHEAARVTSFAGRIEAFKTANPTILVDNGKGQKVGLPLSKEVGGLHGYAKLHEVNLARKAQGLAELPPTVEHAIAEELYDSEIPGQVAVYLSTHPEELAQLRRVDSPAGLTRAFGRLEERVIKADPSAAAALSGGAAAPKAGEQQGTGAKPDHKQPAADSRRKAEDAVDRSVSSAKPLEANLGQPGAGGGSDPESTAVTKGDFGMFQEIQRQRRVEKLQGARAR